MTYTCDVCGKDFERGDGRLRGGHAWCSGCWGVADLRDALEANLSPEAVAAIAGLLDPYTESVEQPVGGQVAWFRDQLIEMLGGKDEYWRIWTQLTVQ